MPMISVNEVMESSFVRVKLVAFVHFVFISNAMLGDWGHGAYEFYNFFFIIAMLMAIHFKDSLDAIQVALAVNACSIFFDLVCIIILFHSMNGWAVAFSIINLLIRPISCLLLYRELNSRSGQQNSTVFPATQQRTFQDMDGTRVTISPSQPQGPNVASIF